MMKPFAILAALSVSSQALVGRAAAASVTVELCDDSQAYPLAPKKATFTHSMPDQVVRTQLYIDADYQGEKVVTAGEIEYQFTLQSESSDSNTTQNFRTTGNLCNLMRELRVSECPVGPGENVSVSLRDFVDGADYEVTGKAVVKDQDGEELLCLKLAGSIRGKPAGGRVEPNFLASEVVLSDANLGN